MRSSFLFLMIIISVHVKAQQYGFDKYINDTAFIVVSGQNAVSPGPHKYFNASKMTLSKNRDDGELKIIRKDSNPVYIERRKGMQSKSAVKAEDQLYEFLEEIRLQTTIPDPYKSFEIKSVHTDALGFTHIRSVQKHNGIEIFGSESILHINGEKERFTGILFPPDSLALSDPLITEKEALVTANNDLRNKTIIRELSAIEKKITGYHNDSIKLVYYNPNGNHFSLCWEIQIRPNFLEEWKYFVDAVSGEILLSYNNTKSDGPVVGNGTDLNSLTRSFNVYLLEGIYYMYDITQKMYNPVINEGIIYTLDANNTSTLSLDFTYVTSTDNSWTQQTAISAHYNATVTYKYFETKFGRNSLNNKGGNIISLINVANEDGSSLENAFWNGQAVFYGNGGKNFKPFAGALDITAHEMTHGLISSSANFEYYGQPGAVCESYADIFACMIDSNDWTLGEDITREGYSPSGAVRDMSDPHNKADSTLPYWQPAHTSEIYLGEKDNGGIHLNSGISNHAFYLYALQIGKDKAAKIYYRALTEYLTKASGFIELRIAVIESAKDFYGENSAEAIEAVYAFEKVGIYEEELLKYTPLYDANPGKQMLLTYDTSPDDPITLYVSTASGTNYRPLSKTPMRGKVSVTDDGKTGVFVSSDRRIRMINTDSSDIFERIITSNAYYDRSAISKDGKRIAATKIYADGSIYVIDLVSGEARQFLLYNPTTSNSIIDEGGVFKAFSVEFDPSGEYLIYDAYNIINSHSLQDIYYWDIGFIKVWDNEKNNFGNGTISKLFSSMPANVNVANPVFSKNSPNIIAFDYFYDDGVINEYGVYAANLESGDNKQVAVNDRLGYPCFSINDDRIAYSTINGQNLQVVKYIKLKSDKITPTDESGVLVPDAKWPVFFATGKRSLALKPVANFTTDFRYGGFPLTARFLDLSINHPHTWLWTFEGAEPAASTEQYPTVTFAVPGYYKVSLTVSNENGENTLTKEDYIHVYDPVFLEDVQNQLVQFFPNPASSELSVLINESDWQLYLYNIQGECILHSKGIQPVHISHLKTGIYVAEIRLKDKIIRKKVVKE